MNFHQNGREAVAKPGDAVLLSDTKAGGWKTEGENEWMALTLSRKQLVSMVAGAEDLLATRLRADRRSGICAATSNLS